MRLTTYWLADAYAEEGNFNKAKYYYSKSIRGYSDDWGIYTNLGFIENKLGNTEKAIRLYQQAMTLDPSAALPRNNLAAAYIEQKKLVRPDSLLR